MNRNGTGKNVGRIYKHNYNSSGKILWRSLAATLLNLTKDLNVKISEFKDKKLNHYIARNRW